jgi:hypothetical protein
MPIGTICFSTRRTILLCELLAQPDRGFGDGHGILILDPRSGKLLHEHLSTSIRSHLTKAEKHASPEVNTNTPKVATAAGTRKPAHQPCSCTSRPAPSVPSLAIVSAREDGKEIALGGPRCFQRILNTSLTFCARHEASAVSRFPRASQDTRKPLQCRSRGSRSHFDSYAGEQQFGGC